MKTLLAWSSGKDSAWALHVLRGQGIEPGALLTTLNQAADRVAMHAVRRQLLEVQAGAVGIPVWQVPLPWPCSNEEYEARMAEACRCAVAEGYEAIAFGDLFLRDVREYRERQLAGSGLRPLFPLWQIPTAALAEEMIAAGLRARVTCVDAKKLDGSFAGREFDRAFLAELPAGVDPCGENGEFHTFAWDGPMFRRAVPVECGETRESEGFMFRDLKPRAGQAHTRRAFLAGAAALTAAARAQTPRDWSGGNPVRYTDPAFVVLDKRFEKYVIGNTPLQRLWTGAFWMEGPAWSGDGRFLVWSDIPNNRQMRWIEEDGHVSVFRSPAEYSNGNTFDYEGRQISCQHGLRRVVRYEPDGAVTVIADKWESKPLNSPNDVVVHPDGAIWFTDPDYGIQGNYEGYQAKKEIKEAVYRVEPKTGKIDKIADELDKPNGICFSPDYRKVYICDTGAPRDIQVFDVVDGRTVHNRRQFTNMVTRDKRSGIADGIRCDVDGNIWAGAGRGGPGYDGVHVFTPEGERIGMIVLPEICANVCFGGARRNRLFMAASQSLYAVYVGTRGAHIA